MISISHNAAKGSVQVFMSGIYKDIKLINKSKTNIKLCLIIIRNEKIKNLVFIF